MRIFAHANYPFLEWRRRAYIITGILLTVGFGAMIRNIVAHGSWMEYGVDFTCGTIVQLQFTKPVSADQIRGAANEQSWEIYQYGGKDEYVIRMPTFTQQTSNDAARIVTTRLAPSFGNDAF